MIEIKRPGWTLTVFSGDQGLDANDDNVDVEVQFVDGTRYGATLATTRNIDRLMQRDRDSGLESRGLYFWSAGLVVVRDLSIETILSTIERMLEVDDLTQAFERFD
ncbi:MAG TPA: hypothetical protein VGS22_26235 [Thermoanaerobaculia bacterium]|jgi:hypothetical protein|nr:hypothetical protein [Thermoanaerobaculia bacterium]